MVVLIQVVLLGAVLFGLVLMVAWRYKRCPSDKVLVVYGRTSSGQSAELYQGGGALVLPLIQGYAWLDLTPFPVEVRGRGLQSADGMSVDVAIDLRLAISKQPAVMQSAAERLLHKDPSEVASLALDVAYGALKVALGDLTSGELVAVNAHDEILTAFLEIYESEIAKVGLEVLSGRVVRVDTADSHRRDAVLEALRQLLSEREPASSVSGSWQALSRELDELQLGAVDDLVPPGHDVAVDRWKRALKAWAGETGGA